MPSNNNKDYMDELLAKALADKRVIVLNRENSLLKDTIEKLRANPKKTLLGITILAVPQIEDAIIKLPSVIDAYHKLFP